jgi:hypothetical protein
LKSPGIVESENFFVRILHSFCVLGEYAESIEAHMENMVLKIVSEDGERIFAYMEMAQRDKGHKSVYITVDNNKNFKFLKILYIYTSWDGLSQKPSYATVPLTLFSVQVCCDVRDVRPAGQAGPGGCTAPSQVHRKGGIRSMSSLHSEN